MSGTSGAMSTEVVIVAAARTPIGSFGGVFRETSAVELGRIAASAVYRRAGVDPGQTDEVIMGCVLDSGLGQNVARQVAIAAGCPETVPAMTLNKVCGSGLRAITLAAQIIRSGDAQVILAGGTENMSRAPYLCGNTRWGAKMGTVEMLDSLLTDGLQDVANDYHMGITAENVARRWEVDRQEQDRFAASSQQRTEAAQREGRFDREIEPVETSDRKGRVTRVELDEFPRHGTTVETLAKLRPAFERDGTVTAGNASGINDGAAVVLVMSADRARELALEPLARLRAYASSGIDPAIMGVAPVEAVRQALTKAGRTVADVDLFEINEAFAAQAVAVSRDLEIPREKLNVNGGAIALGHPIGASGARITVTLLYEMIRRGSACGVASLCIGGGQSDALLLER